MSEDELLNFSGEIPDDFKIVGDEDIELLNISSSNILMTTTTTTTNNPISTISTVLINNLITTTLAPEYHEYQPNPFRIGFLALKCVLIILLFTLSCTIRRDFFKFFVLFLLFPLFVEAGFDIFTEIHAAIDGIQLFDWTFLNLQPIQNETVTDWQKHAIGSYAVILQKYTTYQLYTSDDLFSITTYIFSDFFFWALLFSTTTVFFYAHQAVVRPDQIAYEPILKSFAKVQVFPILFTTIDSLLSIFEVPWWIYLSVILIVRLTACILIFVILTQIFASLFLFCRTKDEITKTSPYEQVRNSKYRLFLFVIFTLLLNVLNIPYIVWCGLSLAYDIGYILHFDWYLPLHFAHELFPLHLTFFLVRPYLFLICSLLLLNPYRRRFVKFFCSCCRKN